MKVYVQGEKKLLPLQSEITADNIKQTLGYTPANEDDLPNITNENDSVLYVVDKDNKIITKTDSEGFHAAAIDINGKDVESGLVTDAERETWNNKPDLESIDEADDTTFYVTDKTGNIITQTDSEGFHTASIVSEDEQFYIVDKDGKIILEIGSDGLKAAAITVNNKDVETALSEATEGRVKDVTVNGSSVLKNGIATLTLNDLSADTFTTINTFLSDDNGYYFIIDSTLAEIGVYNNNFEEIIVQKVYDPNTSPTSIKVYVGDAQPEYVFIRQLSGGMITSSSSTTTTTATQSNGVLIEIPNITYSFGSGISDNNGNIHYHYYGHINVRVLGGVLKAGDRIQLCEPKKTKMYNKNSNGEKVNIRIKNRYKQIQEETLTETDIEQYNNLQNIVFQVHLPLATVTYDDLGMQNGQWIETSIESFRTYTNSSSHRKKPFIVRIVRPTGGITLPISNKVGVLHKYCSTDNEQGYLNCTLQAL